MFWLSCLFPPSIKKSFNSSETGSPCWGSKLTELWALHEVIPRKNRIKCAHTHTHRDREYTTWLNRKADFSFSGPLPISHGATCFAWILCYLQVFSLPSFKNAADTLVECIGQETFHHIFKIACTDLHLQEAAHLKLLALFCLCFHLHFSLPGSLLRLMMSSVH